MTAWITCAARDAGIAAIAGLAVGVITWTAVLLRAYLRECRRPENTEEG